MRRILPFLIFASACASSGSGTSSTPAGGDAARWERRAASVTITRDDWGIAHVRGKSDADAVFGMMYAQAEDDFNRVETNYLNSMGRLAEAEGEREIWRDLRMKLFIDPDSLRAQYRRSPAWLQTLTVAWADGLNFYLAKHPDVRPRVLTRFEPWMAFSFTEGSIGGDIEKIALGPLEAFYSRTASPASSGGPGRDDAGYAFARAAFAEDLKLGGSNGFAVAPKNNVNGRAMLLINPHTSFFFRSEQQVTSEEGLRAYGAATWGQFFLYQGFNDRIGWMHTTSGLDAVDEFLETVTERGGRFTYRYGNVDRPMVASNVAVPYRLPNGGMGSRTFTVYRTHRGPIVRSADGRWVSIALMQRPVEALSQSFLRTKARDYRSFREVAELKANSSNNTIFASADGDIAYFHPHFIPRRDDRFDYTKLVDGANAATDWKGMHTLGEAPHLLNPGVGWIQNTNNWPYSASGPDSPKREAFPKYMDAAGESYRGQHAVRVLENTHDFTLQKLIDAAYDSYQPGFADMVPKLVESYDAAPASDPLKAKLADPIAALRGWDYRWGVASVPTSLAVFWGEALGRSIAQATPAQRLTALSVAVDRLTADFGSWRTPWGEINRFQRLTADIVHPFSDAGPSIPVMFTSAQWGSLASFAARRYPGTKRMYGTSGNSFVAAVEFGRDSVRARAVTAGGESGHAGATHFNDQAERYATGNLRTVYFYPNQLVGHTEREYHPGG